jgi:hypothetical protein
MKINIRVVISILLAILILSGSYWYVQSPLLLTHSDDIHCQLSNDTKTLLILIHGIKRDEIHSDTFKADFQALNDSRTDELKGMSANVVFYLLHINPDLGTQPATPPLCGADDHTMLFAAVDQATAGNANANRAIYAYDLKTGITKLLVMKYGSGLTQAYVSAPFVAYDVAAHGGACVGSQWLEVLNMESGKMIGATPSKESNSIVYTNLTAWSAPGKPNGSSEVQGFNYTERVQHNGCDPTKEEKIQRYFNLLDRS